MFGVKVGAGGVAIADVGKVNPSTGQRQYNMPTAFDDASTWAWIWFGGCVAVIAVMYFGFGGLKGDVAS
jgi:hypothetical protein